DLGVRLWLAWSAAGLHLAAAVADEQHLQQQRGDRIWMGDSLQIAFDSLNNALSSRLSGSPGYDRDDANLALALTSQGPQGYVFVERGASDGNSLRDFPLAIVRRDAATLYEAILPWELLAPLAARAGAAFGFSFVAFDTDLETERQAPYFLALTPGIANGQDPSAYRTFVLSR
ncbi:MAG: hypothetical protein HUU35_18565, partial [Armatimonadetes bacterium]|nr:hypothetical protein [Armatimonadota bacterium]